MPQFDHIKFGRKQIKVKFEKLKDLDGYFETKLNIIVLDSRIKGKRLFNTIIHEIFHMIVHHQKIKCRDISEESLATQIGNNYTKVFKQNPKLWKYLSKLLKG